ncbi:NUC189-domain-containing protein [Leucogyrophana mollusca]|uniref:NUC189-domain-containing protein n=1 Tax=Leucogyrophana mollusca TaxID=85980 RepID=A0ACB8BDZ8_9AGAM|nr:NUC189-domain-containing protein [Leucogyrophana mollusca]
MASLPPTKKPRKSKRKAASQPTAEADTVLTDHEPGVLSGPKNVRYAESSSLAVHSGVELGQDAAMDDLPSAEVDGTLDANLAELSLGQRLSAISANPAPGSSDTSDDETQAPNPNPNPNQAQNAPQNQPGAPLSRRQQKRQDAAPTVVPAHSLTRTLIQALHSADARLLETCLAHSDPALIRNTVLRLPPQLAVPLLTSCMERLGRGARVGNMKGGGGGASAQRGMGLITWVKAVLAVHSGHLMTMPDLVARLSGLHSTLTARLALQESLLSLSGRLDMVLSQIEMRSSVAPAPLVPHREKDKREGGAKEPTRYVEGESEDEDEEDGMDVEVPVESGDDEGSIEDIELGGESEDEEDGSEEEDEDEDSDGEGPTLNGFIDDEAEEFDEDDEDDESE